MDASPLVSVVVPTRNSERHLADCLRSIRAQTYPRIELLVIDNYSDDGTREIAVEYADLVHSAGPERSAQTNAGAKLANGEYLFRVDADFYLAPTVVNECVEQALRGADAVVVHNTPDARLGWLARVRKFEVDMYKYSLDHSAARFVSRELFLKLGGLREDVTAGEDYDFQNRLQQCGARVSFADSEALHMDEPTRLSMVMRKYFNYGRDFHNYRRYNAKESRKQLSAFRRDYLRHWRDFVSQPRIALIFVVYHSAKFASGGAGYLAASLTRKVSRGGSNIK